MESTAVKAPSTAGQAEFTSATVVSDGRGYSTSGTHIVFDGSGLCLYEFTKLYIETYWNIYYFRAWSSFSQIKDLWTESLPHTHTH